jgi:phage-related protein
VRIVDHIWTVELINRMRLTICTKNDTLISVCEEIRLRVVFFKTSRGSEPVREWLKSLSLADKKAIGEDIKTVQFGWPIGMPVVRKVEPGLWEIRSILKSGVARVMFTVENNVMVLIHGFIKKSQKTPIDDLKLARERLTQLRGEK